MKKYENIPAIVLDIMKPGEQAAPLTHLAHDNGVPRYYITTFGRVISIYNNEAKELATHSLDGYRVLSIQGYDGNAQFVRVHRLVAIAFLNIPDGCDEVDHVNRNRSDNRIENLRWVTKEDNRRDAEHFKGVQRDKNPYYVEATFPDGEKVRLRTCNDLARLLGCSTRAARFMSLGHYKVKGVSARRVYFVQLSLFND